MPSKDQRRDSAGPSRDGHEFHEAWTARKAMQLLLPRDGLIGIAVEGLSEEDETRASQATVEVADLTVYHGRDATFEEADRVEILQFKYSPKQAEKEFRASDAKKTIEKFGEAFRVDTKNYGADEVAKKLRFELITNRPFFSSLSNAIQGLANGASLTGDAKTQADQFGRAAGLSGSELKMFASKCQVTGLAGTLKATKGDLRKILVDWSATTDATARARLGDMRDMVRKKAGYDEDYRRVIRQVDVLEALGLSEVRDLLPCPFRLPEVGEVIEREQLSDALDSIRGLDKPQVVHAEGGFGKTVFLESLASKLSENHEVVFFDCFGGGAYRSPEDGRHMANRGLVHIANTLACNGLCDPILPGSDNTEMLFAKFRKRMEQCVKTMASASPDRELILFIDAIDNAAEFAKERKQDAFPTQLIESFQRSGPVPGVKLVLSARTHRIRLALGDLSYQDFPLSAFTLNETSSYLRARLPGITDTEIGVAQARSEGNARILEHLVTSDRGLMDPSEIDKPIVLDDLLQERIDSALADALQRGYSKDSIAAFLAGLSVLPPPVPLDEYAGAHGMELGAIESFAADLAPLLDRTQQGMIFRDEPTETLVRGTYGADKKSLKRVAQNLLDRQDQSVYAAKALPGLLQKLDDRAKLFKLAFDDRFPPSITGTVGRRRVRYARLQAACLQTANDADWDRLVQLLVAISGVAASEQRGSAFIVENPDLVVNANDTDALRRLFETRTKWAGARHARLTIANLLSGDMEDAARHFRSTVEWIRHDLNNDDNDPNRARADHLDRASVPLYRIMQRQPKRAIRYMRIWYHWYGFELTEPLFQLLRYRISRDPSLRNSVNQFVDTLTTEIDCLTGALAFLQMTESQNRQVLTKLARTCKRSGVLNSSERLSSETTYELPDGLRKAAAIAASLGMGQEALTISLRAAHDRPTLWAMVDNWTERGTLPFLFRTALVAAVKGTTIVNHDLLPKDLLPYTKGLKKNTPEGELKDTIKRRIQKKLRKEWEKDPGKQSTDSIRRDAERFLDHRLASFLELTQSLSSLLAAPLRQADKPFKDLLDVWSKVRNNKENRYYEQQFNPFFQSLGMTAVFFAFWARSDLKIASLRSLIKRLNEQNYTSPETLIELIGVINHKRQWHSIAAELAIRANGLIGNEDDVDRRASLYADLSRAMLPVSKSEAEEYFKIGLEQLDSIGSGDHSFTNELLFFASSIKGDELSEKDFHTLTNICELNMSYEEEKFPWGAFGSAMSKTAGPRALAKISRWQDREKVSLKYTLLPYLTALISDEKIRPEYALALNRLADPAEFIYEPDTKDLATILHEKNAPNEKELLTELIKQYEDNNPGVSSPTTVKDLSELSADVLGRNHATTRYLSAAHRKYEVVREEQNQQRNYRSPLQDAPLGRLPDDELVKNKTLSDLASVTDPLDVDSMNDAITGIRQMTLNREQEGHFFSLLRRKVGVDERTQYVDLIAKAEGLGSYAKLNELESCKEKWSQASVSLSKAYKKLALPFLGIHADDLISFDSLSGYRIKELSNLTEVPMPELALELVKIFIERDWSVPASAWLGLATIISEKASEGCGQKALSRLLNSEAANLTDNVHDGGWKRGCYPSNDAIAIVAGFIWQMLSAPRASDRWLAAHSVHTLAKLGCWEVIDALVGRLNSKTSRAFQAPELPFYYLHAKLWLLIAMARIAIDYPAAIAKHAQALKAVVNNRKQPHVLIRHFAAKAILACVDSGALALSASERTKIETVDESFLPVRDNTRNTYGDFYKSRPDDMPESPYEFHLEYDFDKHQVHGLAHIFGASGWEVRDLMGEIAHSLDPEITHMYDKGGREIHTRERSLGITSSMHGYGHYIGWQSLYIAAGKLLKTHQVVKDWDTGRPWSEWLDSNVLTRSDGYWLSDAMDRPPLDTRINVLERGEDGLVLTGNKTKLLSMVGVSGPELGKEIVVEGDWKSSDGIDIRISSALVPCRKAKRRAKELIDEEPLSVWLPTRRYESEKEDHMSGEKEGFEPWVVTPDRESGQLDDYDPLSVIEVERRPYFVSKIASQFSLKPADRFCRVWLLPRRKVAARTEAWGYQMPYEDGKTGLRLVCKTDFVQRALESSNADLLILIKLHRYESDRSGYSTTRFSDTVAVLRVRKDLKIEYFKGAVNEIHKSNW